MNSKYAHQSGPAVGDALRAVEPTPLGGNSPRRLLSGARTAGPTLSATARAHGLRSGLLGGGLSLSWDEGRRPVGTGAVKRHSECQPAQEEGEGDDDDRHLPYQVNRNVDRNGSRLCVVRDARHAHKTQARCRFFLGKDCSPASTSATIGRTRYQRVRREDARPGERGRSRAGGTSAASTATRVHRRASIRNHRTDQPFLPTSGDDRRFSRPGGLAAASRSRSLP